MEEASRLMKRGLALLEENTPASLAEAVGCFDEALALRRRHRPEGDAWAAYLLAASWMNRGDALTRLGGPERLAGALRSYDEALQVLREVPPEADARYRRRHAIAWLNRGATLQKQGAGEEAVRSFRQAATAANGRPELALVAAGAWLNLASSLLRTGPAESRAAALRALELTAATEEQEGEAAETGLKARHVLCQAAAELLPGAGSPEEAEMLITGATDRVEEGLSLARQWEERGEARFCSLARGLFRFGVAAYATRQPQFLAEFVQEYLGSAPPHPSLAGDREGLRLAAAALETAAAALHHDGFASLQTARFDRLLETLRVLQTVEARLQSG